GGQNLRARINSVISAIVPGVGGLLPSGNAPNGPFKLQLEVVHRHPQRSVVVGALIPASAFDGDNLWRMDDLVNGSALAQFGDTTHPACESYASAPWRSEERRVGKEWRDVWATDQTQKTEK